MRILHHYWLSPSSRLIRLFMAEKKLGFIPKLEYFWERNDNLLKLNPSGELPIIIDDVNVILCGSRVIIEYYEEVDINIKLIPGDMKERAEVRRIFEWFEYKFAREVTNPLLDNRVIKRFISNQEPSSQIIRNALSNIKIHMSYLEWLTEKRKWLAGNTLSVADLAAAAHLSVLDYLNDLDWSQYGETRSWYAKIKSRPSFRSLLADHVEGIKPPLHYTNLDF